MGAFEHESPIWGSTISILGSKTALTTQKQDFSTRNRSHSHEKAPRASNKN